jgi:hypothetical protein
VRLPSYSSLLVADREREKKMEFKERDIASS